MQYHWLSKNGNENLIVFFCGWSFDYKPFENLLCENYDVLCFYDYVDVDRVCSSELLSTSAGKLLNDKNLFSKYKKSVLITWSMGVYVAYLIRDVLPEFDLNIAINGTPFPIDDEMGIPVKTFDLTLKYVDTGLQGKFQKNLFKSPDDYEKYIKNPVNRSIENQKAELTALNNFIKGKLIEYNKFYDYAIISDTDKMIPTRNQQFCWEKYKTPVKIISGGHCPFLGYKSWEDIINAS